jgi:hypothetical protein
MTFLLGYILVLKIIASGTCALFSYLSTRRKTAPVLVWRLFGIAFFIWFLQIIWNNYCSAPEGYHTLISVLNDGVLTVTKLLFFMGACVVMYFTYIKRET